MFFPVLGGEHIFEVLYNLVMMSDLHVFFMDLWMLGSYKLGTWATTTERVGPNFHYLGKLSPGQAPRQNVFSNSRWIMQTLL